MQSEYIFNTRGFYRKKKKCLKKYFWKRRYEKIYLSVGVKFSMSKRGAEVAVDRMTDSYYYPYVRLGQ